MQVDSRFDQLDLIDSITVNDRKELIDHIYDLEETFRMFFPESSFNWRISYEEDSHKYRVDFKVSDYGWGY